MYLQLTLKHHIAAIDFAKITHTRSPAPIRETHNDGTGLACSVSLNY